MASFSKLRNGILSLPLNVVGLIVGRSLILSNLVIIQFALKEVLLKLNHGDKSKTQRIDTKIQFIMTLNNFFISPLAGALIDAYGRKPFLLLYPIVAAITRIALAKKPGMFVYILSRILTSLTWVPYIRAVTASMADTFGRGTEAYTRITTRITIIFRIIRLISTALGGQLHNELHNFYFAALFSFGGFLVFSCCSETLPLVKHRKMHWYRAFNPFSFFPFFQKTKVLMRFVIVILLHSIPFQNTTYQLLRKEKFDWSVKEETNLSLATEVIGFLGSWYKASTISTFGIQKVATWGLRLDALSDFNSAFTKKALTIFMNPVFFAFDYSDSAIDQFISLAAEDIDAGHGELSSAISNLTFPIRLVFPSLFSELYARLLKRFPGAPMLVCGMIKLINSEIVIPWACSALYEPKKIS